VVLDLAFELIDARVTDLASVRLLALVTTPEKSISQHRPRFCPAGLGGVHRSTAPMARIAPTQVMIMMVR
jgi:hypothetical protein